jgi:hypothetical protein
MIIVAPLYEGIIEHQHADKIPAFLLRFSHSGRKFIRAAAQGGVSPAVTTVGGPAPMAARKTTGADDRRGHVFYYAGWTHRHCRRRSSLDRWVRRCGEKTRAGG